jgi:hypothetical protein
VLQVPIIIRRECPILFAGEDTAAVKKLHPSKNELAKSMCIP